jgi:copper resistance protein C
MAGYLSALALGAAMIMSSPPAFAHSTVKSTVPANGTVVNRSPDSVFINFNEPARMTSVVVAETGKADRKLEFTPPSGSTTSFRIPAPDLGAGRNEIKWKALSKDGHPISGSIIIVIKAGATSSGNAPATDEKHTPH